MLLKIQHHILLLDIIIYQLLSLIHLVLNGVMFQIAVLPKSVIRNHVYHVALHMVQSVIHHVTHPVENVDLGLINSLRLVHVILLATHLAIVVAHAFNHAIHVNHLIHAIHAIHAEFLAEQQLKRYVHPLVAYVLQMMSLSLINH
jgi:hypothetical protein